MALNVGAAHSDLSFDISSLERDLDDLESTSSLVDIQSDIVNLDSELNNALNLLESARDKGYVYQNDLEDITYQAKSQWDTVRPQVEAAIAQHSGALQSRLSTLNPSIQRLNRVISNASSAEPILRDTSTQVNEFLRNAESVERGIENRYDEIENQVHQLNSRLAQIHWALDQMSEAKFELDDSEDLVMAVPTRWDKESKDDPEGVLYLSNKRLIFEQKEKIATKKVLFITTASELVQQALIDQLLTGVKTVKAANKGLFGHHDFLEVQFSDSKLGVVPFHLDGQDSEEWAALVERAKSGKLEAERATGAGLSIADLTKPLTQTDIIALQNEVNELQDEMMLKGIREELADLENDVRALERDLAGVRSDGYNIESELEADVAILAAQWDRVKTNAETTIEQQTALLSEQMTSIQNLLAKLAAKSSDLAGARPLYMQIKSAIASAEAQADAADATVLAQYDEYADEVEALGAHLDWIVWMLEALSTASFRLLATESGVAAVEAIWEVPSLEPENGILYLTDQRLLWEDRVGDYELKIDVPLQQVADVKIEVDEEIDVEFLEVTFNSGAPVPVARFQFSQPVVDEWLQMIGRARSGDYARDRAVPLEPAELEKVRNAPQQCPNCGAALTAPILRGQAQVICEYCGVVTRL
jgi:predicted  nucleic acid-binding Zn-ribbon protein